jgi:hypothetical protein
MKNDEEKADKGMTNGSRTRFFQRQQKIHDAPRVQHPRWVEPISPTYQSYESRLAELLGLSSHRKRSEAAGNPLPTGSHSKEGMSNSSSVASQNPTHAH